MADASGRLPLSIILPVFNEGASITRMLERLEAAVTVKHEVLVVYDAETDDTLPPVRALAARYPAVRLLRNRSRGVLEAIKTGIAASTGAAVVMTTGEGSEDPLTINAMHERLQADADIACASRYMRGGRKIGGPWLKTQLSCWSGRTLQWLTGVPTCDINNGYKMYRREVFDALTIESLGGYEFSMELTMKAFMAGFRIMEVPTTWKDRTAGTSKFQLMGWLPRYLYWYAKALQWRWTLPRRRRVPAAQAAEPEQASVGTP